MAIPADDIKSEQSEDFARNYRRRQLIDATIVAISEHGLSKITLAKVASAAKLSPGIVNFYFKSKEQLLLETLREMAKEFDTIVHQSIVDMTDPVHGLRILIDAYFNPQVFTPSKVTVWNAFWGETQARKDYLTICGEKDAEMSVAIQSLFTKLCVKNTRSAIDPHAAARGFEGLLDGYWQDLLYDPESFDIKQAKSICLAYLENLFPGRFKEPISVQLDSDIPVRTLMAPWTYKNQEFFDLEMEQILKRNWLIAGHICELEKPGDYITFDAVGERVIVVRGADKKLRAFHNVCRHRGGRIVREDKGNCKRAIVCPFHGWTYNLDGSLKNVPAINTFPNLDKGNHGLVTLDLEVWNGFVFVRFGGDGPSIQKSFAHIDQKIAPYQLENVKPLGSANFVSRPVNWKVIHDIDNEGYHVPIGHPGLHSLFGNNYEDRIEGDVGCAYGYIQNKIAKQWTIARYQKLLPKYDHLPEENQRLWFYFGMFPNAVFELHPDCVSYYMTVPVSPNETVFVDRYFALPDQRPEAKVARYLSQRINNQVGFEDESFVDWVQQGMQTSVFPDATLSSIEQGVSEFHQEIQTVLPVGRLDDAPTSGTVADVNARLVSSI